MAKVFLCLIAIALFATPITLDAQHDEPVYFIYPVNHFRIGLFVTEFALNGTGQMPYVEYLIQSGKR